MPDFPGKSLVQGTTKGVRVLAVGVGAGVATAGGFVLKRVLGHDDGGGDQGADADPIAQTPTAPPGPAAKPVPRPRIVKPPPAPKAAKPKLMKPVKPKTAAPKPPKPKPAAAKPVKSAPARPKPKATAPKPAKQKQGKPKAAPKPKAARAAKKPPKTTGTDAPPKPQVEPGNISGDKDPHHALNNPVVDPDLTEYPDPFEKREDPRDPVDPDGMPFGDEPHAPTGAESTSEPHPREDLEAGDRAEPPERENLDD